MTPRQQLRFLGACLGGRTADREAAHTAIAAGIPWAGVLQRAGDHLVTPSLAAALTEAGLSKALPEDVRIYLETIRDLNRAHNRILYTELGHIAGVLNAAGIEPVLLKGAAALLHGQYPGARDRMIGDLDLRVPPADYEIAEQSIRTLGYRASYEAVAQCSDFSRAHGPPLLHPSEPVVVDLHWRTLRERADSDKLEERMRLGAVQLPDSGVRVQVADPGTRLLHNFLHAQIQNRGQVRRSLDLRQLLDFAGIIGHYGEALDWTTLLARLRRRRHRAFRLYLLAAEHWLGIPYPEILGRPIAGPRALWLSGLVQSSRGLYRLFGLFGMLGRLHYLPRRLLTPSWYRRKIRSLRRGGPW